MSDRHELTERMARAIATIIEVSRALDWKPIETAPKDGTPLLLFARCKTATASAPVIGWFVDGEWIEACYTPNKPVGLVPSHWMRRPDFPAIQLPTP